MRFKSFKIGKAEEENNSEGNGEISRQEVAEMEKKMSDKTKKLEDTARQIKDLSEASIEIDDNDNIPGPHGPLIELTVEPGDEITDIDTEKELKDLMDMSDDDEEEEIKVVEVIDKKVITTPTKEEMAQKEEQLRADAGENPVESVESKDLSAVDDLSGDGMDDSFANLFSDDEEEANPLANLIANLPEVSAQELVAELEEIKQLIKERQQG